MHIFFRPLVLLSLFVLTAFAQPPETKSGTASIAGRITRGDKPVVGALISANRLNQYNGLGKDGAVVKTDEDGRYQFTNLSTGQYIIVPHAMADVLTDYDPFRQGKTVLVQDGEAVDNLDFSLVKGGVITGTITDENGKPVVEASVRLLKKPDGGPGQNFFYSSLYLINRTDDRGVYRLFGLPSGKYLVCVGGEEENTSLQRWRSAYYPQTFHPGVTNEAEAKVVEVTADSESTGVDIKLSKAEKTYTARGRIIDATTETPLVGVRVGYTKVRKEGGRLSAIGPDRTTAQGEFQISGLSPGSYSVFLAMDDDLNYQAGSKKFEIVNSDVNGLEMKASPGGSLSGVVVVEGTKDAALLAEVKSLVLFLNSVSPESQDPFSIRVRINPDGSFRVTGLKPGKAGFNFGTGSVLPKARPFIIRIEKDGKVWPNEIPVSAGENATNVRIVMGYGLGVINGQVNVIGGQPAEVKQVQVFLSVLPPGNSQNSRAVTPGANGRFYIEGVLPGEYRISAGFSQAAQVGRKLKPPIPQPITVTSEKETRVTLTLDLTVEEK